MYFVYVLLSEKDKNAGMAELARECVNSHKGWGASKAVIALT